MVATCLPCDELTMNTFNKCYGRNGGDADVHTLDKLFIKPKSLDVLRDSDLLQNIRATAKVSSSPEIPNETPKVPIEHCGSPPSGYNSSEGEWIWMAHEDWRLLEEFASAASGASDMLCAQRTAMEAKVEETATADTSSAREEALLKELRQMRLQMATVLEEKAKIEADNVELMKNCHFLHQQNKELKQKRVSSRPKLGSSIFPQRRSSLSSVSTSTAISEDVPHNLSSSDDVEQS